MPFDEYKPRGGWLAYYRRQELKQTAKSAVLLFIGFAIYVVGCNL